MSIFKGFLEKIDVYIKENNTKQRKLKFDKIFKRIKRVLEGY